MNKCCLWNGQHQSGLAIQDDKLRNPQTTDVDPETEKREAMLFASVRSMLPLTFIVIVLLVVKNTYAVLNLMIEK